MRRFWAAVCALWLGAAGVGAHPLPYADIVISDQAEVVVFAVTVPLPDLMLAMQSDTGAQDPTLLTREGAAITAYFAAHLQVMGADGAALPVVLSDLRVVQMTDRHISRYPAVMLRAEVAVQDAEGLVLQYDAIIREVPNQRATVWWEGQDGPEVVGEIGYDFVNKVTPVFAIGGAVSP